MTRRFGSWVLGLAILLFGVTRFLSAIGPAAIVFHGDGLQAPLVLRPQIGSLIFMWAGGVSMYDNRSATVIPKGLEGRRFISYDVYWGRFAPEDLKPEAASQHGRLYLATASEPAVVVLTPPAMDDGEPGAMRAKARPIPSQLDGFVHGRALTPSETAALGGAGVPTK